MKDFAGKTAVITGAGSGFGREFARLGARLGMKLVLGDIQRDALDATLAELQAVGADAIGVTGDVSRADDVAALADAAFGRHGAVHLVFNNAGVGGTGGFVWESSEKDWQWVLGVNLWGVIHGIRAFVPRMIEQDCECHVVNTASVAGLLSTQLMGVYNVSKHAVVTLSETMYHDLRLANAKVGVTVLCPAFVPTGIHQSDRNRPAHLHDDAELTASQIAARQGMDKAVTSGRIGAADVAQMTFDAVREGRFYVVTHPKILRSVELRMQDVLAQRNPTDPLTYKPDAAGKTDSPRKAQ